MDQNEADRLFAAGVRLQRALNQAALGVYRIRMELDELYGTQLSFDDIDWCMTGLEPHPDA